MFLRNFLEFIVSIHAPLARSNSVEGKIRIELSCFNTCSSCEEQPRSEIGDKLHLCFNTCSSCEEQQ